MKELFGKVPEFDFLKYKTVFFLISAVIVGVSAWAWVSAGPEKFGIDFLGGYEFVVQVPDTESADRIRKALTTDKSLESATVTGFESSSGLYSIRLALEGTSGTTDVKDSVLKALTADGLTGAEVKSSDFIGPTVGGELQKKALYAVLAGLIGILAYVAVRFEFAFGLGAVVALFHDVIFAMGVYLLLGYTINMETLAAALTIVGYSVNDTVVIFDRVREELFKENHGKLSDVVNLSINATLSRTLITHFLTIVSVVALLVFGGGAIRDMSVFLLAGLISGSYSTMYIASPVMIGWHKFRGGTEEV